jgi:hypothetical protein
MKTACHTLRSRMTIPSHRSYHARMPGRFVQERLGGHRPCVACPCWSLIIASDTSKHVQLWFRFLTKDIITTCIEEMEYTKEIYLGSLKLALPLLVYSQGFFFSCLLRCHYWHYPLLSPSRYNINNRHKVKFDIVELDFHNHGHSNLPKNWRNASSNSAGIGCPVGASVGRKIYFYVVFGGSR